MTVPEWGEFAGVDGAVWQGGPGGRGAGLGTFQICAEWVTESSGGASGPGGPRGSPPAVGELARGGGTGAPASPPSPPSPGLVAWAGRPGFCFRCLDGCLDG